MDDKVLIALLALAMLLAVVVVGMNVLSAPKYGMPKFSQAEREAEPALVSASLSADERVETDGALLVDINRATVQELQAIPDIGPVTAKKIVEYRDSVGTILDIRELLSVDGIGEKTVALLEKYCVIQ